jgi:hypothetical protein
MIIFININKNCLEEAEQEAGAKVKRKHFCFLLPLVLIFLNIFFTFARRPPVIFVLTFAPLASSLLAKEAFLFF